MNNEFKKIEVNELNENVFSLIGKDWMLITSGTVDNYNTMTASWGGMGYLWNKNVCFIFVRPSRYTYEFMEKNDYFTLSFFPEDWRDALSVCGKKSGRDIDKAKETGLQPIPGNYQTTGFSQARLIIECKKLYFQDFKPEHFLNPVIENNYNGRDYHRMYIGEVLSISIK
ncbi:MAG: flavin reductase family protein [Acetivibrionales bacterium]